MWGANLRFAMFHDASNSRIVNLNGQQTSLGILEVLQNLRHKLIRILSCAKLKLLRLISVVLLHTTNSNGSLSFI